MSASENLRSSRVTSVTATSRGTPARAIGGGLALLGLSLVQTPLAWGDGYNTVVTGTRTPELSQRATVKTDVVTREEAERRGATNVAEALATQPGVQVNPGAYGYLGGISAIQIQGFDLSRVLILEDGEPVIGDVGGAIDLASIPMTDIERIEVVTGPTSALYGSSAIGGVVNIITAPPKAEGPSARGRAEYRSYNGAVLQGGTAYRRGSYWVALDLGYTRQDGVAQDPMLPDLQIPQSGRSLIGLRMGARLGKRVDVQLRARWLRQDLQGLESMAYPGIGRFLTDLPTITNRFALHALTTVHFGRASSLRVSAAFQNTGGTSDTIPQGSQLGQTQRSTQLLPSLEATATIADGARTWVAGTRFEARHLAQEREQRQSIGGVITSSIAEEVTPLWQFTAAAYAQMQWKLAKIFTLLPGVRFEYHDPYGFVAAPRLALAFRPTETWMLRASAGRGYRTPSPKELGFNFDHSIYGYKVIGNPSLSPESSWGVNGDVTMRPGSHFTLRVGAFANWVDDLIDIDLGAGQSTGSVVSYSYSNFARVTTAGAQASLACRLGERLLIEFAYDYLWAHDDIKDVPLSGRPPHTLTSSLRAILFSKLELYARAHVVSSAYVDASTASPSYYTVDVRLSRPVWRSIEVYVGGLNLLDVHQTPGAIGDLRPPLGRVFYGGIRAAFPWEKN